MNADEMKKLRLERRFYKDEVLHYHLYNALARMEKNRKLKRLLQELVHEEERHMDAWKSAVMEHQDREPTPPMTMGLEISFFRLMRSIFGAAFVTRLLEKDEAKGLEEYTDSVNRVRFSPKERTILNSIIEDETTHEDKLAKEMLIYEGEANYIRSVIYGLNDGLVELLGVVAGLAVIATSPIVVVIGGLVVGISGTLSMGGGAYLSSKAEALSETGVRSKSEVRLHPTREALYTGVYYFIGAIISILPFALGMSGLAGILGSIILVVIALTFASVVIAVLSYTSVRRRISEMLAISLSVAFVTILLGSIIRTVFGITI